MDINFNDTPPAPAYNRTIGGILGIRITGIGEGHAFADLTADERNCHGNGYRAGAALLAMTGILTSEASAALCPPGSIPCTTHTDATHIRLVPQGRTVHAEATLLHQGQSRHIWNVDITDAAGNLVATARITNQIIKQQA